jgi:hypothetical protein
MFVIYAEKNGKTTTTFRSNMLVAVIVARRLEAEGCAASIAGPDGEKYMHHELTDELADYFPHSQDWRKAYYVIRFQLSHPKTFHQLRCSSPCRSTMRCLECMRARISTRCGGPGGGGM